MFFGFSVFSGSKIPLSLSFGAFPFRVPIGKCVLWAVREGHCELNFKNYAARPAPDSKAVIADLQK